MKIVACYKCVPEEQDISINRDKTLDFSTAQWKVGQYDLNAVEAGANVATTTGGELLALTVGGEIVGNSKMKKSILSRGPDQMFGVTDASLEQADSYAVAAALKTGIEKISDVDLVLCGEGSGDIYAQQVGSMVGAMLGWTTVNAVSKITIEGKKLVVERSLESDTEVLEIILPAVISVTSDINMPRIPGMKDIMSAGKKPVTIWSLTEVGESAQSNLQVESILAPDQADRMKIIIEGDSEENIATFYHYLRKAL